MKKKVLVSAGALALAVGVTAAGTLAYLQDKTDAVTNKFTYNAASQNVSLELFEHELKADGLHVDTEKEIAEGASQDYTIIPGATAEKDPTLRVTSGNTKVYVYAEVKETDSGNVLTPEMADGWTQLGVAGKNGGTVYVLTASQSGGVNTGMNEEGTAAKTVEYPVLESVTYTDSLAENAEAEIVVYGYVVDAVAGSDAGTVYTNTFVG